jgi:hypothetical protein
VARPHREDLAAQLAALLQEIGPAVAARFEEPRCRRREARAPGRPTGLRGAVAAALRWFGRARAS